MDEGVEAVDEQAAGTGARHREAEEHQGFGVQGGEEKDGSHLQESNGARASEPASLWWQG